MKLAAKTALGIDIADDQINLVQLKGAKSGFELLKTVSFAVPKGAIKNGCVQDPAVLSHVIKELKARAKIGWTHNAVVSLVANPVVSQIIEVPKQLPANMGQFVQNEVKRCVALSGKNISFDFCKLGPAKGAGSKILVAAADEQKVTALAEACAQGGLNVEAIEPPMLAYIRALHAKYIGARFDCNVLLAAVRHGVLTICVFRRQILDFVRAKDVPEAQAKSEQICSWLAEQIDEIVRFYDVEVADSREKWEVAVIADAGQLPEKAEEVLLAEIPTADLKVRTWQTAWQDTAVIQSGAGEKLSAVAIGLAMRLLEVDGSNLRLNLAPPESAEVRSVKKHLLIVGNIVAALLLIMILAAGVLGLVTDRVSQRIVRNRQSALSRTAYTLLREQELLEKQIKQLADRPDRLNNILGSRVSLDWAKILADIADRTPQTVRITSLQSKADSGIYLEGTSLSYEAVRLFVDLLNQSRCIKSASASQTKKDDTMAGMVRYSINCSLVPGKKSDAD